MCGIAGIYNFKERQIDRKILHQMDEVLSHRGPDGHGEFFQNNVGLANRRLAIIDPTSAGNQPMSTREGDLWITFNGEIFNYRKLREELEKKNYKFRTQTDTEVLLNLYVEYGQNFVGKLLGQFAFCIYDKKKNYFILARDHLGINPLFYAQKGNTFIFASEVKAILASGIIKKELDKEALWHYLSTFSIPSPLTIFSQIKCLPPGYLMLVTSNGIQLKKYWELPNNNTKQNYKEEEIVERLKKLITASVKSAMVSDVPVGAFLSGGVDSATVASLMAQSQGKKLKTYSLWAKDAGDDFDERTYAKLVAQRYNTDHTEWTISEKDIVDELFQYIYYLDQPNGESFETYFLAKKIGQDVKVALSGLGGDELFAGYHSVIYNTHSISTIFRKFPGQIKQLLKVITNKLPLSSNWKKTLLYAMKFLDLDHPLKKRLFYYFAYLDREKIDLLSQDFLGGQRWSTEKMFLKIYSDAKKLSSLIDKLSYVDLSTYTRNNLLLSTNMASMAHSLEVRIPLLDKRLVEFAFNIPSELKRKGRKSKYIFKEVVKNWLPQEVINHKKTGFGLPRIKYMQGILKPMIHDVLNEKSIKKRGIFNPYTVSTLVKEFFKDRPTKMLWKEHLRIWELFIFELWARKYLD